jgi:hypothetical protein
VVEGKSRRQRRAASRCPAAHGGSSAGTFCDGVSDVSFLEGEVFSTVSPLTLMGWLAQPIRVRVYYYYSLRPH